MLKRLNTLCLLSTRQTLVKNARTTRCCQCTLQTSRSRTQVSASHARMLQLTHYIYSCTKFRSLSRDGKMAIVKESNLNHNCLRPGHFVRQCKSLHKCHECQRPHHSLLHFTIKDGPVQRKEEPDQKSNSTPATSLAASVKPNALLMKCQVLVTANNGLSAKA